MSALGRALVGELDDDALDLLAERLGPRILELLAGRVNTAEDRWLNTREAAEHLGLSIDSVQRLAAAGTLPCSQDVPNGKRWFLRSQLDSWRHEG